MRNMSCTLDCYIMMNAHVSNIAWACYLKLRCLDLLIPDKHSNCHTCICFSLSRIDYCNSLLLGSTHDVTSHLQRIQNYAAQVILCHQKSSSVTTHLKLLHWLPVKVRSAYKIACLCYHCHSSTAPSYVVDMLQKKQSLTPLHTLCLFSMHLHTLMQNLVITCLLLLLFIPGTLFLIMSGMLHHHHHLNLIK